MENWLGVMVVDVAIGADTRLSLGCRLRFGCCLFEALAFFVLFLVILSMVYGIRAIARTVHHTIPRQGHPCSLSAFCLARLHVLGDLNGTTPCYHLSLSGPVRIQGSKIGQPVEVFE